MGSGRVSGSGISNVIPAATWRPYCWRGLTDWPPPVPSGPGGAPLDTCSWRGCENPVTRRGSARCVQHRVR